MFLCGLAAGILDVGCSTLLLWTHGERSGPFMNGLHFFFGVVSLISPILFARVLVKTRYIQRLYYFFAIASIPILLWLSSRPVPHKTIHYHEHKKVAFPIV